MVAVSECSPFPIRIANDVPPENRFPGIGQDEKIQDLAIDLGILRRGELSLRNAMSLNGRERLLRVSFAERMRIKRRVDQNRHSSGR